MIENKNFTRRKVLASSKYFMVLPFMNSLASPGELQEVKKNPSKVKRLVCMGTSLGFYQGEFFADNPKAKILQPLYKNGLGKDFTTFSGMDHKGPYNNGHGHWHAYLKGTIRNQISLDQYVAPVLGSATRYESMQLMSGPLKKIHMAFTETGVPLPVMQDPQIIYSKIFGKGSKDIQHQAYLIKSGKSLLDEFVNETKSLQSKVNSKDRDKLEQYLSSVRSFENTLSRKDEWLQKPYPDPKGYTLTGRKLNETLLIDHGKLMWELMALALINDSCRVFSYFVGEGNSGGEGAESYHRLSHHGNKKGTIDKLVEMETFHMESASAFLRKLKETPDADGSTLLDTTITLIGSGMGDPSNHTRRNFPLMVAGGGFKHKKHISCATKEYPNEMASDLFVTILQKLGYETDHFGTSSSNLNKALM